MSKHCPACRAEACGFRKIDATHFEGFCVKCGATWHERVPAARVARMAKPAAAK